jgi:hypothetical protein
MAEMDALERRVVAALLGYAGEVTASVDAADVARRVSLEQPRRRAQGLVGHRPELPRATWVLVLLAALLGALVGGALVAGSLHERKAPALVPPAEMPVPPTSVAACPSGSNPNAPGRADQDRPAAGARIAAAFDRRAGRLVVIEDTPSGAETWTFDVCTNTWSLMRPNKEPPLETGRLVYDVEADLTIATSSTRVWAYDLRTDTWTEKGGLAPSGVSLLFHDPISGLVVATGEGGVSGTNSPELWAYAAETDTWTPIPQANRPGIEPREYAYDPSVDRMIAYSPDGTRLFDLRTGRWSESASVPPAFSYGWWGTQPAMAYDEAAGRTVLAGQGRSVAYDAATDHWETLFETPSTEAPGTCGTRPECRMGRHIVYDASNGRLVGLGGAVFTTCSWQERDDVQAFDFVHRSWMQVVPPTPAARLLDLAAEAPPVSGTLGRSPWVRAKQVTLHGRQFFSRIAGVADQPWASTPPAAAASVADGMFLPDCQLWTDGTVWWEEEAMVDPSSRAWVEVDLGGPFALDAAVVQADVNDEYLLSYRDPQTAEWVPLWDVPLGEAGGLATRPQQEDASVRWRLARPIVTNALRFEATGGDSQYAVSEIAVFGQPSP